MRLAITNANIITGDGTTILENCSVVVEDGLIVDIPKVQYLYYDPADRVIDAHGNLVIPGIITNHQHGVTFSPLFATAQPPLPEARIIANLDRLLTQGVTTVQSQDGIGTMDEVRLADKIHPLNIGTGTVHTPKNLRLADFDTLSFGAVKEKHRNTTIDEMLQLGASCIGEVGTGIDAHYPDTILLPRAVKEETGQSISSPQARMLHQLAKTGSSSELARKLEEYGLARLSIERFLESVHKVARWGNLAREAAEEGVEAGVRLNMPVVMHNSPDTQQCVLEAARKLGDKLVAAHCNFMFDVEGALAQARRLRKMGAYLDVHTGDMFGVRFFVQSPEVTYALFEEGLVDLIGTDYIGGYWDPILLTLERVVEAGYAELPRAIAMGTSNVTKAFPKLAPNRGLVECGRTADLVIIDREHIARIHYVIISGKVVVERFEDPGLRIVSGPMGAS